MKVRSGKGVRGSGDILLETADCDTHAKEARTGDVIVRTGASRGGHVGAVLIETGDGDKQGNDMIDPFQGNITLRVGRASRGAGGPVSVSAGGSSGGGGGGVVIASGPGKDSALYANKALSATYKTAGGGGGGSATNLGSGDLRFFAGPALRQSMNDSHVEASAPHVASLGGASFRASGGRELLLLAGGGVESAAQTETDGDSEKSKSKEPVPGTAWLKFEASNVATGRKLPTEHFTIGRALLGTEGLDGGLELRTDNGVGRKKGAPLMIRSGDAGKGLAVPHSVSGLGSGGVTLLTGDTGGANSSTGAVAITTGSTLAAGSASDGSGAIALSTGEVSGGAAAGGISIVAGNAKGTMPEDRGPKARAEKQWKVAGDGGTGAVS